MIRVAIVVIGLFLAHPSTIIVAQESPIDQVDVVGESGATVQGEAQEPSVQTGSGLPERAPQARTMRAYWHVFIAFGVTWLLLFGYALSVGRRFGRMESELRRIGSAAGRG